MLRCWILNTFINFSVAMELKTKKEDVSAPEAIAVFLFPLLGVQPISTNKNCP